MSRATVRSAIASYLENAGIDGLNVVKPFPAKFTPEMEIFAGDDPGHSSGVILYIYMAGQRESREALGGAHSGQKAVQYEVVLDCYLRSTKPKAEDAGLDNEQFLDNLVTAIRADRNAGAPSVIFQWGEGEFPSGGADIEIASFYPRLLSGNIAATQIYSSIRLNVVEIVYA